MQSSCDHDNDLSLESEAKLSEDIQFQLKLDEDSNNHNEISGEQRVFDHEEDEDEDEDVEGEEEFSFMCDGGNTSPIAAEDAFVDGKIKPVFPLFNLDLLMGEDGLTARPQVKKVFVEMKDDDDEDDDDESQGTAKDNEASGPYCEWSKEASKATAAPQGCKKSNSTGFSKLWRFKDLLHRSNSDGRDAFVFLNSHPTTSSTSVEKKEDKKAGGEEVKINDRKVKTKRGGKGKTTPSLSPHEIYMRRKTKDDDRRRSYLPYRPEVFGFFTTVNGGMSRNVHPF